MTWPLLAVGAVAVLAGAYLAGVRRGRRRGSTELEHANAELSRRLRELFSLQELSYVLSESVKLDRVADQVARYLIRFLDAGGAMVLLQGERPGTWLVAAAEGTVAEVSGREIAEEAGLVATALARQKLEVADGPAPSPVTAGVAARRAAVAPLRAHGVSAGALVATDPPRPFGPDELRLMSTVAAHAAVVLANARFVELLRTGKEQWESTFDALADGVAVVDEDGRIRRGNRALAQLLNRPIASVIGASLAGDLFGHENALDIVYEAVRFGDRFVPVTQRSDILRRILRISAAPITGEEPHTWVVALIEDVTEQRAFEAQMIQHEKMAAVGQLVSGVAHELNNPLTSIAGLSELLLEQHATAPRTRDHLRIIHEQAERAGKIVRNLLTFARQGPAEVASVDLNDVAQRTVLLMEYEVRLRQIELVTELSPEPAMVRVDRMQIQQVLVNLLTNALHAVADNPAGRKKRVTVRTREHGTNSVVEVEDTGPGIPDELMPQIFTPFFTTKDPGQGTGLGLAISYSIIERHGGTLSAHRAPRGGAVFVAELPGGGRRASTEAKAVERASRTQYAQLPGGAARHYRLLLVDGDPAVQRMISVLFSSDGHSVEAARDGAHALELLERERYDLIIADPRAAASAGETLAQALRTRWPELKHRTIFATADVRPETEAWLRDLGWRYFLKPVNARQLRAAAADLLTED